LIPFFHRFKACQQAVTVDVGTLPEVPIFCRRFSVFYRPAIPGFRFRTLKSSGEDDREFALAFSCSSAHHGSMTDLCPPTTCQRQAALTLSGIQDIRLKHG